jgi:hypothetical protein
MNKGKMFAVALGAALMIAAPAEAQMRTATFGVGGGPSFPIGHLADDFGTGFHVQGSFALAPMTLPFGVRADLFYQRMTETAAGHTDDTETTLAGIVNGIFALPGVGVRPYVSAGVGAYNTRFAHAQGGAEDATNVGVNGGAGVQFGLLGMNAFLEGKFHNVFTANEASRFIPITIGIMF